MRWKIRWMLLALVLPAAAGATLGGCDRQEGTFEEAGETIDDTAEEAEEKADEATGE